MLGGDRTALTHHVYDWKPLGRDHRASSYNFGNNDGVVTLVYKVYCML